MEQLGGTEAEPGTYTPVVAQGLALGVHPDRLLILGRNPGQLEAVPVQVGTHLLDELAHGGLGCADGTELLVGEVGGIDDQVLDDRAALAGCGPL